MLCIVQRWSCMTLRPPANCCFLINEQTTNKSSNVDPFVFSFRLVNVAFNSEENVGFGVLKRSPHWEHNRDTKCCSWTSPLVSLPLSRSMGQTDGSSAPLLSRDRIGDAENQSVESTGGRAASVTDYGSGVYRYPLYLQPGQFTSLEKLMFFVSSTLLILLCVFIGLYARSSFQDRWHQPPPTIPLPTATPTHTPTPPEKV